MIFAEWVRPLSVALVLAMMAGVGMKVRFAEVAVALRQTGALARGVLASFVLTPAITLVFLHAYHVQPMVAVGFLILATCAGAPFLPVVTGIAKGDVAFSVGLMVVLSGLTSILTPALLALLLSRVPGVEGGHVDSMRILKILLLVQLLPLCVGLAVHECFPKLARILVTPLNGLNHLALVTLNVALFIAYWESLKKFRPSAYIGMLLLFMSILAIGWLCGGRAVSRRKATALGTAVRSGGVGLVIVIANFPGTPAVPSVTVFALVLDLAAIVCAILMRRWKA
ncbi:BASS family bile acid:Na+ symporter [Paraburkholderia sp. BL8N3]|nr:bile acid:sodium symporter [Paraburkholderia sp. BL8N3]TCK33731.1 BASS family bile acid:Na+ symporter [Paraburkholderia sp. BL8N3]